MPPVPDRREPEQLPGAGPRITQGWATSIVSCPEPLTDCVIGIDVSKATRDLAALPDGENWTVANDDQGLATPLEGDDMGLDEVDNGIWSIYFCNVLIARLDERKYVIRS